MKLRFTIQYATQWGESMHVVLSYRSMDGTERTSDLQMTTQDGLTWTLDTAAIESRHRRMEAIRYHYQVEDGDGKVLRREWSLVPRTYYFDASKSYVFNDLWNDMPLCSHLYSNAYLTTQHARHGEQVEARRVPLYRKTVIFRVSAPQLVTGQSLALLGSHPMIGNWSPGRYLKMEYIGQGDWLLSVNMDAVGLPMEYKYVVVDDQTHELLSWEDGDNRLLTDDVADGEVRVLYGGLLRLKEKTWRAAGVVVPVFSLRSEHSFGVGDFGDLKRFVDWAVTTGMKIVQLLPVNDTTTDGHWHDSYPYNITSCFALHPHYMDLEQLGELKSKQKMTVYRRQQRELNALPQSDYEAVERVKHDYINDIFAEHGQRVLASKEFKTWFSENEHWLKAYADWRHEGPITYYIQYNLHLQLKAAADYARSKGVVLKGDLPIGVNRDSVETKTHPELFNMDSQTGAPPDAFSKLGQNWGFPTYHWGKELTAWMQQRYQWMEQYFDAIRVDHVLGFFRIWEIPVDAVYGLLGHFSPALPLTVGEIEYFGLPFRRDLFTRPFINDRVLERLFGMHAQYVRDTFLIAKAYGLYDLKADYDTQRKVMDHFEGRGDENSLWIREGLMRLVANVLFVEDPRLPEMYHPRILAYQEPIYEALNGEEKDAYMRLYNNYFYQRHSMFWGSGAIHRLTDTLSQTRMLICAEDLGMLPDCVAPVLDALRILTLEIQTMPKQTGYEYSHLDGYPYRSVATFATHDMSPLRLWWEESPERTQRYYVTMLQKEGRAPEHLPAHLAEEIIARHLYCPSMLCLLSLQDWLAMDSELRRKNPREERINVPSDHYNRWQYRMHLTIEELLNADKFNSKIKTMITRSKR
ncbi:MAG: 4-alpha-glucanotransferase [Prevotella sp.]|nr:4-alpha-glucanotransferase [Prevotella sp.]